MLLTFEFFMNTLAYVGYNLAAWFITSSHFIVLFNKHVGITHD